MRLFIALALLPYATCFFNVPFINNPAPISKPHPSSAPPRPLLRPLFGILDEVNDESLFSLSGTSTPAATGVQKSKEDAFEIFLAEMVFSTQDVRVDIIDNFERASDPEFMSWLRTKSETSTDVDEREALRSLLDTIEETVRMIELKQMQEEREGKERAEVEAAQRKEIEEAERRGADMTDTDVLRKAAAVDNAGIDREVAEKQEESFLKSDLTPEIRMSYKQLIDKLLPPYRVKETPEMVVRKNYEMCDAQLIKCLVERKGSGDGSDEVLAAISKVQEEKVAAATASLKKVLAAGSPDRMEGEIIKLAREGGVDESFLLLLEANMNMALEAGASGPAEVMRRLKSKAESEKDKQQTAPEIVLLRKLMREEDNKAREALLEEAFTPKEKLLVPGTMENAQKAADGEVPEEEKAMPDVPPPDFINACKAVLLNFGNVKADDKDVMVKVRTIAAEAEIVATRIYGKGMSNKEQQDRAWKQESTSIFDLERMELEAMSHGEKAPWANEDDTDDLLPPMFDKDGKMSIGGG
eukprot:CAMPEP_0182464828 /NCGR_PEP_ID=MMETSP1319-20130603/8851_1 /TAXON_ID=172717 /ORGANISM="Bolidomonas pacifica, Strain RCC208" /LENGTH=526 /DNA_ID=CAMNT_0024664491 /DNA_START=21 /DNA_END=1601 /DNA_ORIENTATION=+